MPYSIDTVALPNYLLSCGTVNHKYVLISFENYFHLMQLLRTLLSKFSKQVSQTQIATRANGGLIK